ncbi:MAG TPA: triphosphoribosyl-dephospho-CoA synthase [Pirellulaceae bacterium]|nr:triphosphoribosyl-dephospho-CoA synthase [Pirellulaceae bacterium]
MPSPSLSIGQCATLACVLEATAPKVGNVHRSADFDDLTFTDFLVSAVAIGPVMERAASAGVGRTVLDAVRVTSELVPSNVNLGIALLLAPLAAVPRETPLMEGVANLMDSLTAEDSKLVYEAIALAKAGGLGTVDEMDIQGPPPENLLLAMAAARDRDLIARQYVEDFALVLDELAPAIANRLKLRWSLTDAIVWTHVGLIARHGDSLIERKCGPEVGKQASAMAAGVLAAGLPGEPGDENYYRALADFDFWLRSDGHRRNPGTTADLIAAALFVLLRDGLIDPPYR